MDRHTLFCMQAGLLVFLGLVTAIAHRMRHRDMHDTSPYWFAASYIVGGIGLGLQAERGHIAPIFAIIIGNSLFFLLYAFLNKAIAVATKQKSAMWLFIFISAATVASFWYFTYIRPNLPMRVVEAVLVSVLLHVLTVILLFRNQDTVIQPAVRGMAYLFIAHMSFSLLGAFGGRFVQNADIWFAWMGLVTISGMALSFLWIDILRMSFELKMQAMSDPLTGLLNRRGLDLFASREIDMAVRNKWPCSALMMDVDNFKEINDRYGHSAGDTALIAVADVLNKALRTSDLITRVGGDEFFVLLPNSDEKTTNIVVVRLHLAVRALRLHSVANEAFEVCVSIGQTTQRGPQTNLAEMLHAADIMLYSEKQSRSLNNAAIQRVAGAQVQPSNS